jgi:predicted ester cyclase
VVPEVVSPDYLHGNYKGPDGWKDLVSSTRAAFPDLRETIEQVVGEGDWLAYRISCHGTFTGEFRGNKPTGKEAKWTQAIFSQFKDGKLLSSVNYSDTLTFYTTLGINPPGLKIVASNVEANKANELRLYEEVWNKGNFSLIPELVSPDFSTGVYKGHEGYRRLVNSYREPMPDLRIKIDEIVGDGDKVVYRLSGTGTYTGKILGVDVTSKKFNWTQAIFTRYKDGKVAEGLNISNALAMYQQAGITPPVAVTV